MARISSLQIALAVLVAVCAYFVLGPSQDNSIDPIDSVLSQDRWFAAGDLEHDVLADTRIYPFRLEISTNDMEDMMYHKLQTTRLENHPIQNTAQTVDEKEDWSYGVPHRVAQLVLQHYTHEYNWTLAQTKINDDYFPNQQFTTKIGGLDLHFVHIPQEKDAEKEIKLPPVLLLHGWPGSFLEFRRIAPLLTARGLDVVIPSLPGHGPSQAAQVKGMNIRQVAFTCLQLMERLYGAETKFYVQGGDWGAFIAHQIAYLAPQRVKGVHLNFFVGQMPLPMGPLHWLAANYMPCSFLSPWWLEAADVTKLQNYKSSFLQSLEGLGYFYQQSTRPDTLGYALQDSPSGWALWVLDKVFAWADVSSWEELQLRFELDEWLTTISVYYLTGSITTAARFYKENLPLVVANDFDKPLSPEVPVMLSDFPGEIGQNQPKIWAQRRFPGLVGLHRHEKGGHFAAMEQPEVLAADFLFFVEQVTASGHP